MTLIDGDRIVTVQLYDDEHEEFIEKKMSIIDCINTYTDEGVTTDDDVLDKIRAEIAKIPKKYPMTMDYENGLKEAIGIIDKYKAKK